MEPAVRCHLIRAAVRVTEQSDHVRELHGHKVVGPFEGYITYE
jgi:hypothetical protein